MIEYVSVGFRYLLVLQFDTDHSEGVAGSVVVDVDATESLLSGFDGNPLLTGVIVDHDGGSSLADALLAGGKTQKDEGFVKEILI